MRGPSRLAKVARLLHFKELRNWASMTYTTVAELGKGPGYPFLLPFPSTTDILELSIFPT